MGMLSSSRTMADSSAFAKIVDGHHAEIRRYLRRVAPHRADADALCEETFVRAFRAHRSLTADVDVRAWLFAIATRLCRTPRSARRSSSGKLESAQPYAADGRTPEGEACAIRTWSPLERAIGRLAVAQRLALAMRKLHHLDYAAIGACLDCFGGDRADPRARGHAQDPPRVRGIPCRSRIERERPDHDPSSS
jgi:RNA polymerase sigma-70 factor, ECF subfamily